jgi:hypothetical protein
MNIASKSEEHFSDSYEVGCCSDILDLRYALPC